MENLVARASFCVRVRQRQKTMWSALHSAHLNVGKETITTAFLFVVHVINKHRERERDRK